MSETSWRLGAACSGRTSTSASRVRPYPTPIKRFVSLPNLAPKERSPGDAKRVQRRLVLEVSDDVTEVEVVCVGKLIFEVDLARGRHDLLLGHTRTEFGGDLAARHHDDAMSDAQAFADLRRRIDDREPTPRALSKQLEDLGLRANIDAAAWLVEQHDGRIRSPASSR